MKNLMYLLNINNLYIKTCTTYLKKHNLSSTLNHKVNIRYATNSITFLQKTGCRKMYDLIGTQIHNIIPREVVNMSLPVLKKCMTHWLLREYDASVFKYYFLFYFLYNLFNYLLFKFIILNFCFYITLCIAVFKVKLRRIL